MNARFEPVKKKEQKRNEKKKRVKIGKKKDFLLLRTYSIVDAPVFVFFSLFISSRSVIFFPLISIPFKTKPKKKKRKKEQLKKPGGIFLLTQKTFAYYSIWLSDAEKVSLTHTRKKKNRKKGKRD